MQILNSLSVLCLLLISPLSVLAHGWQPPQNPSEQQVGPLVRFDAPEKATASVILLHGLGNTWDIFNSLQASYHSQDRFKHINFVFPNSPVRDTPFYHLISGNSEITHSWFNMSTTGLDGGFDENQYWQIVDYIDELIQNETISHGIPPERIIAGGFSQGGMVTLGALSSIRTKIAGWLYFPTEIPQNLTSFNRNLSFANQKTPVFHGHGYNDPVINVTQAIRTGNTFKSLGFNYELKLYQGMSHQVDWPADDEDAQEFVARILPKKWFKGQKGWK